MAIETEWLRGCATALVTPFRKDGSLDEERMTALVERQIKGWSRAKKEALIRGDYDAIKLPSKRGSRTVTAP